LRVSLDIDRGQPFHFLGGNMWIPGSVITFICVWILWECAWEIIDSVRNASAKSKREEEESYPWDDYYASKYDLD